METIVEIEEQALGFIADIKLLSKAVILTDIGSVKKAFLNDLKRARKEFQDTIRQTLAQ